jgi:hypothetical protein
MTEALQKAQQALAIKEEVLGKAHEETFALRDLCAMLHEDLDDFAAAQAVREEILRLRTDGWPPGHWQIRDAQLAADDLRERAQLSAEQRADLRGAAISCRQQIVQRRILVAQLRVLDDRDRAEQLQGRLPQVIGRQMPSTWSRRRRRTMTTVQPIPNARTAANKTSKTPMVAKSCAAGMSSLKACRPVPAITMRGKS